MTQTDRVRRFYDRWTTLFVDAAGTTLQAGLLTDRHHHDPLTSMRLLAGRAGIEDGERILDAGCGVGGPAIALAREFPALHIDGVTISPVQVGLARTLIDDAGLEGRVRVHLADYHALPYVDGTFDRVLVLEASCYSDDRPAMIAELSRVLRPGGILYVKDVFVPVEITDQQRLDLDRYDQVWGCASTPTVPGMMADMTNAGLVDVRGERLEEVSVDHFYGSAFDVIDGRLVVNEFGRHFLLDYTDLPIFFAEVTGRKP